MREAGTTPSSLPSEWLTVSQAAQYLQVNEAFIRRRVRTKAIPFVRMGTWLLRFHRRDLDEWLQEQRHPHSGISDQSAVGISV
jgi:excisionase family DNA binding protein